MRSGNDASSNSKLLVNQSIIDDYGSAQEITNQITNKIYKTSVKPYLVKGAVGSGAAAADFSINGEGAINSSFNSSSMLDHSTNNSKMVNNPSQ